MADGADLLHPTRLAPSVIDVIRRSFIIPFRSAIHFSRHPHPQCFMRTLVVVFLSPKIEGRLVTSHTRSFQFTANVPVHPFMPAIVLWTARPIPFQINPQRQPPDR